MINSAGKKHQFNSMFNRVSSKPLKLDVEGRVLNFPTLDDFDFALTCRVEVPASKITSLVQLTDDALREEARSINKVEKRFVDLIASGLDDQATVGRDLRTLDIKLFSHDHQWRSIMGALRAQGPEYDEYKKLALIKYMQYLSARQEVVKSIFSERQQRASTPVAWNDSDENVGKQPFQETGSFKLATSADTGNVEEEGFLRLPKGEVMTIPLSEGHELELLLAEHRFRLVLGQPAHLLGENGAQYDLRQGKNLIGRELGNHIVVDSSYRDVSRKHLLIDTTDPESIRLTDMSSHGTFVRAAEQTR